MNKSTIIVPISNYDVNEGFPKSFENNEKFEWNCIVTIDGKEHLVILKFVPDETGIQYLREEKL